MILVLFQHHYSILTLSFAFKSGMICDVITAFATSIFFFDALEVQGSAIAVDLSMRMMMSFGTLVVAVYQGLLKCDETDR